MMAKDKPGRQAHTWFNRFWKLLERDKKTTTSHETLLQLAAV